MVLIPEIKKLSAAKNWCYLVISRDGILHITALRIVSACVSFVDGFLEPALAVFGGCGVSAPAYARYGGISVVQVQSVAVLQKSTFSSPQAW